MLPAMAITIGANLVFAPIVWSAVTPYLCSTRRVVARDISVGSRCMPVNDALGAVDDLATSRAFEATFDNMRAPFSRGSIAVPVMVAFGDRDWILLKRWRRRNKLPAHTRWVEKQGWGHIPMSIDPVGVSHLIVEGAH